MCPFPGRSRAVFCSHGPCASVRYTARVVVVYENKEHELELSGRPSLTLDVIQAACAHFSLPTDDKDHWAVRLESGAYLKQSDLDNGGDATALQKGTKWTLKLNPLVEVQETLKKIKEPEKNKMSLHLLSKNYLRDQSFVDAWLERGGLKALVDAMLCTNGSTQVSVLLQICRFICVCGDAFADLCDTMTMLWWLTIVDDRRFLGIDAALSGVCDGADHKRARGQTASWREYACSLCGHSGAVQQRHHRHSEECTATGVHCRVGRRR